MGKKLEIDEEDEIDFEIQFFEGLVHKQPDFVEALSALGDVYTKVGAYEQGLAIDERLAQLRPDDPVVFYNLSCSYSLLNEIDKALRSVKKAIKCGYSDFEHMQRDKDLLNLRQDERFQRYFERIKRKAVLKQ